MLKRLLLPNKKSIIVNPVMRCFASKTKSVSPGSYIDDIEFLPERVIMEQDLQIKLDSSIIVTHRPDNNIENMLKHDEVTK